MFENMIFENMMFESMMFGSTMFVEKTVPTLRFAAAISIGYGEIERKEQ